MCVGGRGLTVTAQRCNYKDQGDSGSSYAPYTNTSPRIQKAIYTSVDCLFFLFDPQNSGTPKALLANEGLTLVAIHYSQALVG